MFLICPVCGGELVSMLDEFSITAATPDKQSPVSGLAAFRCDLDGHVVFIRKADLPARLVRSAVAAH